MATQTRIYKVALKDGAIFLVEAISVEQAIKIATAPLVESATIPTPLEAIRLQADGAKLVTVPIVEIKGIKGHELPERLLEEQTAEDLPPLGDASDEQVELPPLEPNKSKRGSK